MLLFLIFHALTGCDTVSAFCGRGKKTAWNTVHGKFILKLPRKLETSKDQKFKMQKSHKRELDDVAKKTRKEVQEVG